ncbi:MAG: HAD family hydrolase, partial [Paraclostridium sp.]|uniref:HAD family hydrolase n=1 Tax=Paraclostridium sp. TaxID=2023273 RepID=UPI003F32381C
INLKDVEENFFEVWMDKIKDRKVTFKEYPIEDFLNLFLKKYNVELNLNECIEAINLFYTEYRENVCFENTIHHTLKIVKDMGYKIGVISNTCYYEEVMKECFKKAEIFEFIDCFIFSYSLKCGKPDKEIFRNALEKMNVLPNECIMIGDNLNVDIKPAQELGMNTIWLNNPSNKELSSEVIPNIIISHLSDLPKHLNSIISNK